METKVAKSDELADGQLKQVQVGERAILLAKIDGEYYALAGKCPHYGAPLAEGTVHEGCVVCPWHHSAFNLKTGQLREPPAFDGLTRFTVHIRDGEIYVDIPDDAKNAAQASMFRREREDPRVFAVIGGGAAGAAAVEVLRQEGYLGRLLLISAEDQIPYDRPNCSKEYLAGGAKPEWMPLRSPAFYDEHDIERWHRKVASLDVPARTLQFENGESLTADAILIATGGVPRKLDVPGAELPGVLTLRSLADADALIAAAQTAKNAVVIGASFIAMEVAASLRARDLPVTVVAPDAIPFQKSFGPEIGGLMRHLHEEHGTVFKLGRRVKRFIGTEHVCAVELDDGSTLDTALVVVGIGVRPATSFIHGYRLNFDGSLNVDRYLSLAPGVYAAGDVARYPDVYSGERIRVEHWRLALQHGRTAAKSMLGRRRIFRGVPFFWTTQFKFRLGYTGYARTWNEILISGDLAQRDFTAFFVKNGLLRAAVGTQPAELAAFTGLMQSNRLPTADYLRGRPELKLEKLLRERVEV